jgi:hypothetical protein
MPWQDLSNVLTVITGIITVLGVLWTAYSYLGIKSRTDRMALVGGAFRDVITGLGSDREADRLAGAVLLRRFFDPLTEYGVRDLPYASESVNVIAALLRMEKTGVFQKLLADGLAFAPTLEGADLQEANLEKAYLGDRSRKRLKLDRADLYRARLCEASLAGASAVEAVFYEADLTRTVFVRADLRGADFRAANLERAKFDEADLAGARFDEARLSGASFRGARNIPPEIQRHLTPEGKYP